MEALGDVLGSLGFNWHIALANFFNFLIIFFLLQKYLFKKVATTLAERKTLIEDGVRKSEESETILNEAKQSAKSFIVTSEKKSSEIIKLAEEKATLLADGIKKEAMLSVEALKADASKMKENAYEAGLKELSLGKEKLIAQMFEKAMGDYMTEERNNDFIASLK